MLRISRKYATHRDPLHPSTLSQSLDTRQYPLRPEQKVGPFEMGMNESPFAQEQPKKWKDLSGMGKIKRTTARTTNLAVIVFGAGLTAVLLYAVSSELFSKNSPTTLYSDACERIKRSPQVAKYLRSPLSFHTTRLSGERPRGRQHQVTSQIFLDNYGREHMMITFYVQGSSLERSNLSYYDSAKNWISQTVDHLPELTLDEFLKWTKDHSAKTWDQFVQSFKYLSGTPTAKAPSIPDPSISTESKAPESNTQKWTGIFSSLRKTRSEPVETRSESPSTFYTDGEAHAEFIRILVHGTP
ncbi:TIM21-domain-containing protein [Rhodocollybia butyracea]|uniref:Mitochondrial import inner membrane translocase subunit Tim21 n=1 Tax=Rhodocollybia butyracea TaxID=206335 RepID=A0A9P5Q406_9AGAR|nr:TIM21-domain-containing protein [Rhodocollybia butyracea]